MKHLRTIALSAVAGALVSATLLIAPANATDGSGFAPSPIVNGHFGVLNENTAAAKTGKWGMHLKTLAPTDMGVDKLTVQPSGFSGWHAHPAPVFVTVTRGTITWFDGGDPLCTGHTYTVGQSFIEDAYVSHNVVNPSSTNDAEFIAIVIKPINFVGPLFRLNRPEPNNCNF